MVRIEQVGQKAVLQMHESELSYLETALRGYRKTSMKKGYDFPHAKAIEKFCSRWARCIRGYRALEKVKRGGE